VRFVLDNSKGARDANIESAIHLADNTHAFEDKLPEVLYGVPESLETMRLLKIAGEIGDSGTTDLLKERLVRQIEATENFSEDDKVALGHAARSLQPASYKFTVPRILGNKPELTVSGNGDVMISVHESAIHHEVTGLFNQKELAQFQKFVKDLGGPKDIDPEATEIHAGPITARLVRPEGSMEVSDYQARLNDLVEKPAFRRLVEKDNELSARQNVLEGVLARGGSEEIQEVASAFGAGSGPEAEAGLLAMVENIKIERRQGLAGYIEPAE
jgi:hypothetical protein